MIVIVTGQYGPVITTSATFENDQSTNGTKKSAIAASHIEL